MSERPLQTIELPLWPQPDGIDMATQPTEEALLTCCASRRFAAALAAGAPYATLDALVEASRTVWWHQTPVLGWLEAFAAHPKIGDMEGLRKKYGGAFGELSKGEQDAASGAPEAVLQGLAEWNARYEAKFGHIFIICATGKSAQEMLEAVQQRFANSPAVELTNAAVEQQNITELRLRRTFGGEAAAGAAPSSTAADADRRADAPPAGARSPITTHVLDTCLGRPAPGVGIILSRAAPGSAPAGTAAPTAWELVAQGRTNKDGRVGDLLPPTGYIAPGHYRIAFDVNEYQQRVRQEHPAFFAARRFYPAAAVDFEIRADQTQQHFHVPLTWNPFGYSTYRGS